ncbi:MAG: iron-containing alcohol dehydrogenase [Mailhella sp.]|nr:iron-containing alcohol dehydrogenase [Mailhella sp.]
MLDFTFHTPTKVVFGRKAEEKLGALLREQGCHKVLVHFGGGSVIRSGLLERVRETLRKEGLAWVELGGVVPNPRLSLVNEGIDLGRREGVDFILAVGGGSVIDSAKAIGYGLGSGGDVWELFERKRKVTGCTPLGVVLTIAATGSEMSPSCVITAEDGWKKRGCTSELCRPRFAVMDPQLTMTLPDYQTASGCVDILMHTMERWFYGAGGMDITEGISASLMRTVMKHALILRDDPQNYESRAEILWAGALSHNGLTGCGSDGGDWAPHKIEHELSGLFDVAHGAGLAAIWGSWARFVARQAPERFVRFAERVMGVSGAGTDQEMALQGIEAFEDFCRAINMPVSLSELGIAPSDAQIREMAEKCIAGLGGPVGKVVRLTVDDVEEIYRMAR